MQEGFLPTGHAFDKLGIASEKLVTKIQPKAKDRKNFWATIGKRLSLKQFQQDHINQQIYAH